MLLRALVLLCLGALASAVKLHPIMKAKEDDKPHECCAYWYSGNQWGLDICCMEHGYCPICPEMPQWRQGCYYRGSWYHVGATMGTSVDKCYSVRCWWSRSTWPAPTVYNEHASSGSNCCEYRGRLYGHGDELHVGGCKWRRCLRGDWGGAPSPPGENRPCQAGTTTFGHYCIVTVPKLVPWWETWQYCSWLGGWIFYIEDLDGSRAKLAREVNGTGAVWIQDSFVNKKIMEKFLAESRVPGCYYEGYLHKVGWVSGYYPAGRFSPVPHLTCTCHTGNPNWVGNCNWSG